jgi:endonuclease-3
MPNKKAATNYKVLQKFLNSEFPNATTTLIYKMPFQLLVATILSAQCTDVLVNKITLKLFRKYPDSKKLSTANINQLRKDIYPITFYNNKAKSIRSTAEIILKEYNGEVPRTIDDLIKLPGVARKTANVVLGHAYNIHSGIVVDTHVLRVSKRFGLTSSTDPKIVEQDLIKLVAKKDWIKFSDQIIQFGKKICRARGDKCDNYPAIRKLCSEAVRLSKNKTVIKRKTK